MFNISPSVMGKVCFGASFYFYFVTSSSSNDLLFSIKFVAMAEVASVAQFSASKIIFSYLLLSINVDVLSFSASHVSSCF